MDRTEKIIVRLTPDKIIILQALVSRGEYDSLSETVFDAINKMIDSKFTPDEVSKILKENDMGEPIKMESLLAKGEPESMDDAVRRAVKEYVKTRM